jgi:hypothetical protein
MLRAMEESLGAFGRHPQVILERLQKPVKREADSGYARQEPHHDLRPEGRRHTRGRVQDSRGCGAGVSIPRTEARGPVVPCASAFTYCTGGNSWLLKGDDVGTRITMKPTPASRWQ